MAKPSDETFKSSRSEEYGSKEHLLRRSKRKNISSQNEVKEMQKEDNPPKNLKMKSGSKAYKVKKASKDKKPQHHVNQSNLDSYVSVAPKSNDVTIPIKKELVSESSIFQDETISNTTGILTGKSKLKLFNVIVITD